ncbi:hypothetical protein DAIF1_10890 [Stenotrophomonas indicatrix]|nr:hypothetical protein DAIF1_10890 [Stenotrophomonas indicatrix]
MRKQENPSKYNDLLGLFCMKEVLKIRTVVNTKSVNNYSLARQGSYSLRLSPVERKPLHLSAESIDAGPGFRLPP